MSSGSIKAVLFDTEASPVRSRGHAERRVDGVVNIETLLGGGVEVVQSDIGGVQRPVHVVLNSTREHLLCGSIEALQSGVVVCCAAGMKCY